MSAGPCVRGVAFTELVDPHIIATTAMCSTSLDVAQYGGVRVVIAAAASSN